MFLSGLGIGLVVGGIAVYLYMREGAEKSDVDMPNVEDDHIRPR